MSFSGSFSPLITTDLHAVLRFKRSITAKSRIVLTFSSELDTLSSHDQSDIQHQKCKIVVVLNTERPKPSPGCVLKSSWDLCSTIQHYRSMSEVVAILLRTKDTMSNALSTAFDVYASPYQVPYFWREFISIDISSFCVTTFSWPI